MIGNAVTGGTCQKFLEGLAGLFREALDGFQLFGTKFDGSLGQGDRLFQRIAVLLQQFFNGQQVGVQRGKCGIVIQFLLELGEAIVQLAVEATAGEHQLVDKLDAASTLCIGKRQYAVEFQLFLLKGFPESCQLSCYGSDVIHYQVALLSLLFLVLDSNSGRTWFRSSPVIYIVSWWLSAAGFLARLGQLTHCFS